MASDKMKVRQVPASTLRPGDIFFDSAGNMVSMIFRSGTPYLKTARLSCINTDGLPCLLDLKSDQIVTLVTDRRVIGPREA